MRALPPPVAFDADDQALLDQVVDYYHETLKQSPEALAYLKARGIDHPERSSASSSATPTAPWACGLPDKSRKAGAEIRAPAGASSGSTGESGHEHFNGSLVIPVLDAAGDGAARLYGRKIRDDLRPGTPKHLYLPGPHRGRVERGRRCRRRGR